MLRFHSTLSHAFRQGSSNQKGTKSLVDIEKAITIITNLEHMVAYANEQKAWWHQYLDTLKANLEKFPAGHPDRKRLEEDIAEASRQIMLHRLTIEKEEPVIVRRRARLAEMIKYLAKQVLEMEDTITEYDDVVTHELNTLLASEEGAYEQHLERFNEMVKSRRTIYARLKIARAELQLANSAREIQSYDEQIKTLLKQVILSSDADYDVRMQSLIEAIKVRRKKEMEIETARTELATARSNMCS
jgi:hypothetical protein